MTFVKQVTVLHCVARLGHGGVERRRLSIVRNQIFEGNYKHYLLCQEASPPISDLIREAGCEVIEIGKMRAIFDFFWFVRAVRIGKALNPDIIHGAVFEGNLMATAISLFLPQSKLIIEETSDLRGRSWKGRALSRMLAWRATFVVGIAPEILTLLATLLPKSRNKLRLVTNGVDRVSATPEAEIQRLREELGLLETDFVIGFSGRLEDDSKRVSDLIRVVRRICHSDCEVKLLVVGDGPSREALTGLALRLDVQKWIVFAGYQPNPRKYLALMDIFVLPSAGEGMPLALMEAMHAGLACVASSVGGVPGLLDHGQSGLLVSPGNLDELENAVRALLSDSGLRICIGARAKNRALRLYSSENYLVSLEKLWCEALASKNLEIRQ